MLCYDLMISGCCCSVPGRGIVLVTHHTLALDHGHNSSYATRRSLTPRPQNNVKLFHLRHDRSLKTATRPHSVWFSRTQGAGVVM